MTKAEALAFIREELEKGTEKEAIINVLLKEEKIGNSNATNEVIEELINRAKQQEQTGSTLPPPPPPPPPTEKKEKPTIYEEWKVENGEKVKMIRTTPIDDETANRLNMAAQTSDKGYVIMYYKK